MEAAKDPDSSFEIQTPLTHYNTHEREFGLHYFNTYVRMYADARRDRLDVVEQEIIYPLYVPDKFQRELESLHYPFTYFPDEDIERFWYHPGQFQLPPEPADGVYDPIVVNVNRANKKGKEIKEQLTLYWTNTRLRIYGEPDYTHVEVRVDGAIKGIKMPQWIIRQFFDRGYPIEYLPTVDLDPDAKKWYQQMTDREGNK